MIEPHLESGESPKSENEKIFEVYATPEAVEYIEKHREPNPDKIYYPKEICVHPGSLMNIVGFSIIESTCEDCYYVSQNGYFFSLPCSLLPGVDKEAIRAAIRKEIAERERAREKEEFERRVDAAHKAFLNDIDYIFKLRHQAAISCLNGMMSCSPIMDLLAVKAEKMNMSVQECAAHLAVTYADELIKKLQQPKISLN